MIPATTQFKQYIHKNIRVHDSGYKTNSERGIDNRYDRFACKIETISFYGYPVSFMIFAILYWLIYLHLSERMINDAIENDTL